MKLLFLAKRRPQRRDLVSRPYGRFHYLPAGVASRGHEVHVALLSYVLGENESGERDGMTWSSNSIRPDPTAYARHVADLAKCWRPHWIVGFSDTYYGILAVWLSRHVGARSLVDAYDNYEAYMPWAKPLHWLWRGALKRADVLTAAGPGLLAKMSKQSKSVVKAVVPMAADPGFVPLDQATCRRRLSLPVEDCLIGYAGSAMRSRGIAALFPIMAYFEERRPDVRFIFSGRRDDTLRFGRNASHLGYLEDECMPCLINAMDLTLAPGRQSRFGLYSYPVKIYESLACGKPVIASRTAATEWILEGNEDALVDFADTAATIEAIERHLDQRIPVKSSAGSWNDSTEIFLAALDEGTRRARGWG